MLTVEQRKAANDIGHNMRVAQKDGNRNMIAAWANVANNWATRVGPKARQDFVSAVFYAHDTASV